MAKESFLLVSLKEEKAKELANVISNESCRKILEYLAEKKDSTESEVSESLAIPISTVHYNLQHLTGAGLVASEEFHYSKKGKEVNHYKLANKYIIIAPKSTFGIKEKLKAVLPAALLAVATAGIIGFFGMARIPTFGVQKQAGILAAERVMESGVQPAAEAVAAGSQGINPALWFLAGALFTLAAYAVTELVRAHKKR